MTLAEVVALGAEWASRPLVAGGPCEMVARVWRDERRRLRWRPVDSRGSGRGDDGRDDWVAAGAEAHTPWGPPDDTTRTYCVTRRLRTAVWRFAHPLSTPFRRRSGSRNDNKGAAGGRCRELGGRGGRFVIVAASVP